MSKTEHDYLDKTWLQQFFKNKKQKQNNHQKKNNAYTYPKALHVNKVKTDAAYVFKLFIIVVHPITQAHG